MEKAAGERSPSGEWPGGRYEGCKRKTSFMGSTDEANRNLN